MTKLYPCKDCIVKGLCRSECDKLLRDDRMLRHMVLRGDCPDCGCRELHIGFIFNEAFYGWDETRNSRLVDQYDLRCNECSSYLSIYMNLTDEHNTKLNGVWKVIMLPRVHRRSTENEICFSSEAKDITSTTYDAAIRKYIIPRIDDKYGKLSKEMWNNAKWEEEKWRNIRVRTV